MKVSVICVYNNKKQYNEQLLCSLNNQDFDYEMIGVDNTDKRFSSAASALNYGVEQASGDILVFAHQDITVKGTDELRIFAETIDSLDTGNIIGTQGAKYPSKEHITNLTSGDCLDNSMKCVYPDRFYEVDCVDEGFFGMKRKTWKCHKFDEVLCDNWHLYCVELCLYARTHNKKVYVCPIQIHHYSKGHISISYMNGLKMLCHKYRSLKHIWTTCYKVKTASWYINLLVFAWVMNRKIKRQSLT